MSLIEKLSLPVKDVRTAKHDRKLNDEKENIKSTPLTCIRLLEHRFVFTSTRIHVQIKINIKNIL